MNYDSQPQNNYTYHSPRTTTPSDNEQETPGTDDNGQRETCLGLSTIECIHSLSKLRSIVRFKRKVQGGTYRLNTYLSVKQGISGKKSGMIWNAIFLDPIWKHYLIAMDQNSTGKINNFDYTPVFRKRTLVSFYLAPCSHNITKKKKKERKIKKRREEGHPSPCHPHQMQITISLPYESHLGKPSPRPFKPKLDFGQ